VTIVAALAPPWPPRASYVALAACASATFLWHLALLLDCIVLWQLISWRFQPWCC